MKSMKNPLSTIENAIAQQTMNLRSMRSILAYHTTVSLWSSQLWDSLVWRVVDDMLDNRDCDPVSGGSGDDANVNDIGTCPTCSSVALHLPG